jgi:hypothetical protein
MKENQSDVFIAYSRNFLDISPLTNSDSSFWERRVGEMADVFLYVDLIQMSQNFVITLFCLDL